jgi:transcription initiation factor TFIIIB Brf1 subunit/transcription initiation factor TFIIB
MLRYSQYFPISEKTRKLAISTIESLEKSRTVRKSPRVVAATVTYIACKKSNEVITQVQIAKAFGISSASIRNCVKLLHKLPRDVLNI